MGKANRNRAKRAHQRAGGPAGPGLPGFFDGIAERDVDNVVEAWGLLNVYLQLTIELDDSYPIPDAVSAQDPIGARQLAEGFAGLRPHAMLGLREDAAFFVSRISDVEPAAKAILAGPRSWLRKSGYRPDLREWFTGACRFVPLMVAEQDRDSVLALLDYDNLMAGSDDADRLFGVSEQAKAELPPWFSLDDFGPSNTWFYVVRQFDRAAGLHAAACLATWLFFQPGAVKDQTKTLLALTQRGYDAHQFVAQRRGAPPQQSPVAHSDTT
jgi:hypothetical protein